MGNIKFIDRIQQELLKTGVALRTKKSRAWLLQKMKDVRLNIGARRGLVNLGASSKIPSKPGMKIGKMYMYFYNPKTAEKLKYYDIFPLVFPISYKPAKDSATGLDSGLIGLNLHYINPRSRLVLLDQLYTITSNDRFDETTKIKLSYSILVNNTKMFELGMPCLHWYLFKYFSSRALEIPSNEWEECVLLPFESFQKKSKEFVWKDSNKKRKQ